MNKDFVVIGAGLTGLTLAYYLKKAGKNILLIEKEERTGGVIQTVCQDGFTFETGPSTGVLSSQELVNLFDDLGESCAAEIANPSAKKRYIWKNMKWEPIPGGHDLVGAVTTPLFTLKDKFRVLGEVFKPKGGYPDESVAELVVRRLGRSILDYAVDPFVSGVYAGDPKQLIVRHALPKLYALEQNYGGFVRGTIAKHKEYKKNPQPKVTKDVFSVEGGLQKLIDVLTENIGLENILTGCSNVKVQPGLDYEVSFKQNAENYSVKSNCIITTTGGYALASVLPFIPSEQIFHMTNTTYASVIQVAAGYKKWNGVPLDAFGGLVPSKEKRQVLGVLFPSAIFKNRCPEGGAMLSVFMGGMKKPDFFIKTDDEIKSIAQEELRITMKTTTDPDLLKIYRYKYAIAQYDVKTEQRLQAIKLVEQQYPGLIIAGSIRDGIGISDRVKQAVTIANQLLSKSVC